MHEIIQKKIIHENVCVLCIEEIKEGGTMQLLRASYIYIRVHE